MIIAYIVIIVVLLLILITLIPLALVFEYKNHLKVYVKVFGIKFTVYDKSKTDQSFSNEKQSVDNNENPDLNTKISLKKIFGFFQISKEMLRKILTHIKIKKLYFHLNVGGYDSSEIAIKYGKTCSVVYPLFEYVLVCKRPKDVSILVSPNFGKEKDELYFELELYSQLIHLLFNMMVYAKKFRNLLKNEGE